MIYSLEYSLEYLKEIINPSNIIINLKSKIRTYQSERICTQCTKQKKINFSMMFKSHGYFNNNKFSIPKRNWKRCTSQREKNSDILATIEVEKEEKRM